MLNVKPQEVVFVGDSIEQDYEGALGVGIKPYLIDREGKAPKKYDKIRCLNDLLTVI